MKCGILRNGLLLALIMVTLAVLLLVHPAAGESDPGKKEAADAYKKAYQLLRELLAVLRVRKNHKGHGKGV
jgi:hypothetical protein